MIPCHAEKKLHLLMPFPSRKTKHLGPIYINDHKILKTRKMMINTPNDTWELAEPGGHVGPDTPGHITPPHETQGKPGHLSSH